MGPIRIGPYLAGPNSTEENGIYVGDSLEISDAIPDSTFDIVFCDPVYEDNDQYEWLSETSRRVLKPDSACLAWYGGKDDVERKKAMGKHLRRVWDLKYVVKGKPSCLRGYGIYVWTTLCLWFRKGKGYPVNRIPDTFISHSRPATRFKWNKNPGVCSYWLQNFVTRGSLVFDPFTGEGVIPKVCKQLGLKYLAFEINEDRARRARTHVREAEEIAIEFLPQYEQKELF